MGLTFSALARNFFYRSLFSPPLGTRGLTHARIRSPVVLTEIPRREVFRTCGCLSSKPHCILIASPATLHAQQSDTYLIPTSDGIFLDATVVTPDTVPPAGGFPGVVLVHGYGGTRMT